MFAKKHTIKSKHITTKLCTSQTLAKIQKKAVFHKNQTQKYKIQKLLF